MPPTRLRPPLPTLPQVTSAPDGADWLAGQLDAGRLHPRPGPGQPDLAATANVVLALASAGTDPALPIGPSPTSNPT